MTATDFLENDTTQKQSASDFLGEADEKVPVKPSASAFLEEEISQAAPRALSGTQPIRFSTPAEPIANPSEQFATTPFSKELPAAAKMLFNEAQKPIVPIPKFEIKPEDNWKTAAGKEVVNFLTGIPEFLESPLGIATLPMAAAKPTLTAAVFTGSMVESLGEQAVSTYKNWANMTPAQKSVAVVDMAGTGTLAGLLGRSTVKGMKPKVPEVQGPPATGEVLQTPKGAIPPPLVAEAAAKPTLVPALLVDGKPVIGGDSHAKIATNYKGENKLAVVMAAMDDKNHVFIDENNNVLTRDEAKPKLAQITGKPVTKPVDSSDIPQEEKPPQYIEPKAPLPGEQIVTVQRADGSTYKASYGGKNYTDKTGKPIPSLAKMLPDGEWSHGMLAPDEKILESPKPTSGQPVPAAGSEAVIKDGRATWTKRDGKWYHRPNPLSSEVEVTDPNIVRGLESKQPVPPAEKPGTAKPVIEKSPIEILNTAKTVGVTLPEDATMIQVSHKKGVWGTPFDPSTLSKASGTRTANTFIGTDPIAVRGVSVGRGKEVKVSTGEVKIQPLESSAEKRARAISEFPKRQLSRAPGAAAGGEPGTYSAIQQLADQLEATGKENAPVNERVSAIEAVKVKATELKDGVKSTLANVLAIKKALWDSYVNLAPYTDMKRIVGKWFYANQRADFEAREFGKQIIRAIPDKLRREAITNWIQADGDVAALKERAAASRGALKRGYEIAQKLTPRETEIAQLIREYYDRQLERGINEGLLKEGLDNYITQVWKKENPITRKLMNDLVNSKLQPNFKFARKRIFDSYFEGEQAGLKPSKDAGFLVSNYDQSFNKSLAARAFIKDLHEGLASDGRPLVEVSGSGKLVDAGEAKPRFIIKPKATPEAIGDYKTIDHPALRGWKWLGKTPEGADVLMQGELKVHPEIYDKLKNRLSTSWFRQHPVPRAILNVQSTLKQSMMSISGFHQVQENLHALGHRVNPMNLEKLDFSEPVTKSLVEHGLQIADYNSLADFGEGLSSGKLLSKIPFLGSKLQAYNDWLFQDNIPRLKLTMAKHALERNKERYADAIKSGKITPDQVLELTASQANHAFGELPYKYWGRNPNLQDAYRTFLLAPDFLEARAGFAGQALKPGGLGAKGLLKNEQLQALALLALTQYVTARIANQVIDQDPHWEVKNAFRIIYGNHAYSLRTVPGDIIHLLSDPRGFTFNRLSPVIGRGSIELATGRDYRGVKRDFLDQMGDLLKSGIPISMNHKNGQNILETFGNALGVQNQRYDAQQNIQQKAADFKSANNIKVPYETIYNPDDDKFSALRNAIHEGNQKLAQSEFNKLKGIIPPSKIYQHFKLSLNRTLTGSRANDQKFYNGLNEVGKIEYKMAQDLQRSRLKMALSLKTTLPETPQENYINVPSTGNPFKE
jgi:hypothetical protein